MSSTDAMFTYFGVYLGTFGGIYLLAVILDRYKFVDKLVECLTESAYSKVREELLSNPVTAKELEDLEKEEKKGCCENICACECFSCSKCCGNAKVSPEGDAPVVKKYHRSFRVSLLKERLFYNLKMSDIPKNSCISSSIFSCCCEKPTCCCCFTENKWVDMLYYFLNNHSVLAMFAAEKEHPTSRAERRMDYFIQHSIALAFSCAIVNGGFDFTTALILNVFVGTPIVQITKLIFFYLTSCPCLEFHSNYSCISAIQSCLIFIGESMGKIIAIASIFVFLAAASLSYQTGDFSNLGKYCYQIFVISQAQELILSYLKFSDTHLSIQICSISVFETGDWTVEYAKHRGIDLHKSDNRTRMCCLVAPCIFAIYANKSLDTCTDSSAAELEMGKLTNSQKYYVDTEDPNAGESVDPNPPTNESIDR